MDKSIHLFTDNEACKYMLISMRSKLYRPDLQILINKICLLLLDTRINFRIDHIPGKQNILTDNLSRYTLNPLGSKSLIFHTRINSLQVLQSASDLTQYFKIDPRRLKWIDEDDLSFILLLLSIVLFLFNSFNLTFSPLLLYIIQIMFTKTLSNI